MTKPRRPSAASKRTSGPRSAGRLQRAIDEVVRREVLAAMKANDGNVTHAARDLGISVRGLWKRLETLDIDAARYRR